MVNYLTDIFKELNSSNIRYAVLRGYETLPHEISHDIDFGVYVKDLTLMIEILEKVSSQYGYKLVYRSVRKDIVKLYFYNHGNCLKLDLLIGFSYKGLKYLDIHTILQQIKIHNGIKVLNDDAEVSLSFLKEFLHNGWIREDKLDILKEKLSNKNSLENDSLYLSEKDKHDFASYISNSKVSLKVEAKEFRKRLFIKNLQVRGNVKTLLSISDYVRKFIKDALKKKGFFVVLMGPDGSGKTTLAKKLINEVEEKTCCFTSSYYLHGRFGIIPNLATLMGKEKEKTNVMKFGVEQSQELKPHSAFRIMIYMVYYSLDFALGYFKLLRMKFSHKIIVADRYFYDYFYQEHFRKYPKILYFLYMKMLPAPDLVIFLKADAEAIYARKPELSIERINIQQKNIQQLLSDIENSVTIDSSQELTKTYNQIRNSIVMRDVK